MSTGAQNSPGDGADLLSRVSLPLLVLLFVGGLTFTAVQLDRNQDVLIARTAAQHAKVYADTLDKMRELYATEVVETARKTDIRVTHDYLTEENAIPLPITLSRRVEENAPPGVSTRMYSPFPFEMPNQPVLDRMGPEGKDDFAWSAWRAFNVPQAERPPEFYRVEEVDGVSTLRYAIPETMKTECVTCHNDYVGSPKTDWSEGDVRGVLEVAYPIENARSLASQSQFEAVGTLAPMLLLAVALMGFNTRNHRRHREALEKRVRAQQQAAETMEENAGLRSRIERQMHELLKSRLEILGNDERLRQVLDSIPVGVVVVDAAGTTEFANDPALALLGEAGVLDGPWRQKRADTAFHLTGRTEPCSISDLPPARALRGESSSAMNFELRRDDVITPVLMSAVPIFDAAGEVAFAIMTIQDVTDEKRLEQQARQAQRLLSIGRLAGGVAHDFNNVLTAISGFVTYAMEELDADDPAYADLQQVMKAAGRGEGLTRQLLAFSRQHSVNAQVIEPNTTVASIERMLQVLVGKNIELVTQLSSDLPNIRLSGGALDQVVMNLAVNARDAMPVGGTIRIGTEAVTLTEAEIRHAGMSLEPGDYVCLSVQDTGVGMDEATRRQVFDPFFTTKEPGKGTGLGMSTCWGIVRQSDGYIAVESEINVGSTVRVYLPAVHEPVTMDASASRARTGGGTATILVVEDDEEVLDVVERSLKREGFKVLTAIDGQEALEIFEGMPEGSIDLLLTDVRMPRVNGIELVRQVAPKHPQMQILYMSAYIGDVIAPGENQPTVELLQKPFTPDDVAKKVREVLGTSAAHQPSA